MRAQLNGLKALIDAILTVSAAQVDAVTTISPGQLAEASVSVSGNTLHFTFDLPRGADGVQGLPGNDGPPGPPFAQAIVDGVNTVDPEQPAVVSVWFDGANVHFTFDLPRGQTGVPGVAGPAGPPFATVVVDSVTTLNPGEAATVSATFDGTNVHFSFGIPRGFEGPPGDVSTAQLQSAIAGTSSNSNSVTTLEAPFSNDPPTFADLEILRQKLNELILVLRR